MLLSLDEMPSFFTETAEHVAKAKGRFCAQKCVSGAADGGRGPGLSSGTAEPRTIQCHTGQMLRLNKVHMSQNRMYFNQWRAIFKTVTSINSH